MPLRRSITRWIRNTRLLQHNYRRTRLTHRSDTHLYKQHHYSLNSNIKWLYRYFFSPITLPYWQTNSFTVLFCVNTQQATLLCPTTASFLGGVSFPEDCALIEAKGPGSQSSQQSWQHTSVPIYGGNGSVQPANLHCCSAERAGDDHVLRYSKHTHTYCAGISWHISHAHLKSHLNFYETFFFLW